MRKNLVFWVLFFLLGGCASKGVFDARVQTAKPIVGFDRQERWGLMTGKWLVVRATDDGGFRKQLTERVDDGTYTVTFHFYDASGRFLRRQAERGRWGMSGPVYFTLFEGWLDNGILTPADTSNPYHYDSYEILDLSDKRIRYRVFESGEAYEEKKVSVEFLLAE